MATHHIYGVENLSDKSDIKEDPFNLFPSVHLDSCHYDKDNPGPVEGVHGHAARLNNFWARYVYGNRSRGIKLCHWNIGGGYLHNKTDTIACLVEDYTPHVLGISEASFRSEHNLEDVQLPKYKLYLAKTLKNPQLNNSRVAVYVHEDIIVKVRDDLMND